MCQVLDYRGILSVEISVPEGEKLAEKTFNPRLGIVGGISILGTSGVVEPMSTQAILDTIRVELQATAGTGERRCGDLSGQLRTGFSEKYLSL